MRRRHSYCTLDMYSTVESSHRITVSPFSTAHPRQSPPLDGADACPHRRRTPLEAEPMFAPHLLARTTVPLAAIQLRRTSPTTERHRTPLHATARHCTPPGTAADPQRRPRRPRCTRRTATHPGGNLGLSRNLKILRKGVVASAPGTGIPTSTEGVCCVCPLSVADRVQRLRRKSLRLHIRRSSG